LSTKRVSAEYADFLLTSSFFIEIEGLLNGPQYFVLNLLSWRRSRADGGVASLIVGEIDERTILRVLAEAVEMEEEVVLFEAAWDTSELGDTAEKLKL
jgi:hypothetical protein